MPARAGGGLQVIKPLWGLAGVALLASAGVAGTVIVVSSGGEEEVSVQATASASPVASEVPGSSASQAPSPTPKATQDATLPYTDPTYDYSFEYPRAWFLSSSKEAGGITTLYSYDPATIPPEEAGRPVPPDKLKAEFVVLGNPQGLSLDAWIAESRASGGPVELVSRSAVAVDDTPGIAETVALAEGPATQYFIARGSNVYVISKYPSDSFLSKEFDVVLTSFKF